MMWQGCHTPGVGVGCPRRCPSSPSFKRYIYEEQKTGRNAPCWGWVGDQGCGMGATPCGVGPTSGATLGATSGATTAVGRLGAHGRPWWPRMTGAYLTRPQTSATALAGLPKRTGMCPYHRITKT